MAITAANRVKTTVANKENLFLIPGRVWPLAGAVGFAGNHMLVSFKGNCIRGARLS